MIKKMVGYLKSRTVWTFIFLFVVNGFEGVREFFSPEALVAVNALLVLVGTYFRVNARQQY